MTYATGWPGRIDPKRHAREVMDAFEKGRVKTPTNAEIVFNGTYQRLWTFEGPRSIVTGTMAFHHYGAKVMGVDFDNDRVTDFGFSGHSTTTTLNINLWLRALREMEVERMFSLVLALAFPFAWTRTVHNKLRGAGYHEEMWQRFRARVPWVWKSPNGDWWFHGPGWSEPLCDLFERGREEALNGPNNEHPGEGYRWFTYDWDKDGRWAKRFIDERAEQRYHAWRRRKGLA